VLGILLSHQEQQQSVSLLAVDITNARSSHADLTPLVLKCFQPVGNRIVRPPALPKVPVPGTIYKPGAGRRSFRLLSLALRERFEAG
jgi:hypothetical protein